VVVSASARMGPLPVREAWRAGSPVSASRNSRVTAACGAYETPGRRDIRRTAFIRGVDSTPLGAAGQS
jgi:hypothetical protein